MKKLLIALLLLALPAAAGAAEQSILHDGDFLAICGDSITEQKMYSVYIEDYLLMCQPKHDLRAMQFGWGGETAPGFLKRMDNDVLPFPITLATTCYGMNDGGYGPLTDPIATRYRDSQKGIVEKFRKAGARVVLGSPGCVDSTMFKKDPKQAEIYNKTLGQLRDIDREIAAEMGVAFADVHGVMMAAMGKGKAKYADAYDLAGRDGVHPNHNGHLVMAYAFLKAMGCDGDIGTITIDVRANEVTASEGHKVVSCKDGTIELESSRYPFCFFGDPKDPGATSGVIELIPFNQDLNRFRLVVKNPEGERVKVTWGNSSKEFTAEQAGKGINLAAEFVDNPFKEQFAKVEQQIRKQQEFETPMMKDVLHRLLAKPATNPAERAAAQDAAMNAMKKAKQLNDASIDAVKPVRHTLRIE